MTVEALRDSAAIPKAEYQQMRAQLLFQPHPGLSGLTVATNLGVFGLVVWLIARETTTTYWVAQLLLPIAMFQAFAILHDCGHGSFSRSRFVNLLVGHYASILCCMPYLPWKYVHAEHHVWAGNAERDPGLAIVRRARSGQLPWILKHTWKIWLPIAAVAQHVVYWAYPITELRRGKLRGPRVWYCAASVALLAIVYVALHALAPELFRFGNFAPGIALYLIMVELVNLPHHVGLTSFDERLPLWEQHLPTRSCYYPPVLSEFLMLNFNFHIEHHLFPNLPWYRLRTARALVFPQLGVRYRQTRGFNWLIRARKRHLIDVLAQNADDLESVRPVRGADAANAPGHGRQMPTA